MLRGSCLFLSVPKENSSKIFLAHNRKELRQTMSGNGNEKKEVIDLTGNNELIDLTGDNELPGVPECCVCLRQFGIVYRVTMLCSHSVCLECYSNLLQRGINCPFCRKAL